MASSNACLFFSITCESEASKHMTRRYRVRYEDLSKTQLWSQSPQPSCGSNLWHLPESLTWGFSNYWRVDERTSHPAVHSAPGHRVPEGPQQVSQMHEVHLWLWREEGGSQLSQCLGHMTYKCSLGCAQVTIWLAREDLKHLLLYPYL